MAKNAVYQCTYFQIQKSIEESEERIVAYDEQIAVENERLARVVNTKQLPYLLEYKPLRLEVAPKAVLH